MLGSAPGASIADSGNVQDSPEKPRAWLVVIVRASRLSGLAAERRPIGT